VGLPTRVLIYSKNNILSLSQRLSRDWMIELGRAWPNTETSNLGPKAETGCPKSMVEMSQNNSGRRLR